MSTLFFSELKICSQNGWELEQWGRKPRWQKRIWLYWTILDNEKERVLMDRERAKAEAERARIAELPRVEKRFRRGG